jgi:hypothetical protein
VQTKKAYPYSTVTTYWCLASPLQDTDILILLVDSHLQHWNWKTYHIYPQIRQYFSPNLKTECPCNSTSSLTCNVYEAWSKSTQPRAGKKKLTNQWCCSPNHTLVPVVLPLSKTLLELTPSYSQQLHHHISFHLISSMSWNLLPFNNIFSFGNRKKSHGAMSSECTPVPAPNAYLFKRKKIWSDTFWSGLIRIFLKTEDSEGVHLTFG